jgi:hypothetical protein
MVAVDLSVPTNPRGLTDGASLESPRNAWADFALQLDAGQLPGRPVLRLPDFGPGVQCSAYQVLPAPANFNTAQYVRQTGERAIADAPQALLPLANHGGTVDLSTLRDPFHPTLTNLPPIQGPVLIWVDLHIDGGAPAGDREGNCQLLDSRGGESAGTANVHLTVSNVTLPSESHLHFAANLHWADLLGNVDQSGSTIKPPLLRRGDGLPAHAEAITLLDQYIQLGHENKTDIFVTDLEPIVKWPLGKPPEIYWADLDSLVAPWLTGRGFADHQPVGFWPLPEPDSLSQYDLATQTQYWQQAARHFDQRMWLDRSPVVLKNQTPGAVNQAEAIELSAQARQILLCHPRIGVLLPMQQDQVQLLSGMNGAGVAPATAGRIYAAAPGLISPSPIRNWPEDTLPPRQWIDAQASPTGLFNEQSVRLLAWLAFARDASLVRMGHATPDNSGPSAGNDLPLIYPPSVFATNGPLPSLGLKWIRAAEQDYECLWLAAQQKDRDAAMTICRLVTRSLQLQPTQQSESVFDLLAGVTEPDACEQARRLVVGRLSHHASATDPVELQTLRWQTDRQRPALVGDSVKWMWNLPPDSAASGSGSSINTAVDVGAAINAVVSVDLYNPIDSTPLGSQLQWLLPNPAWQADGDGVEVPPLGPNQVRTIRANARFNLNQISDQAREPIQLRFADGSQGVACKLTLPVAAALRRDRPIHIDGSLDEWSASDAILFDQPMVKMLDRRSLLSDEASLSQQKTSLFGGWSDDHLYLAFRLGGVTACDLRSTRNFVDYDHGRAWGEDLCEVLIQPIYLDNTPGPTLHIVSKPGGEWVEQQSLPDDAWHPFEASGVRYASGVDAGEQIWRGELAIPWRAIQSPGHGRPALLRFNFIQHIHATGESASWAGPMDQSRDCKMAGLVAVREK